MPDQPYQPLPRIYPITLIVLSLLSLTAGYLLHRYHLKAREAAITTQTLPAWELAFEEQLSALDEVIIQCDRRLEGLAKSRFRMVLPVLFSLQERARIMVAQVQYRDQPLRVKAKLAQLATVSVEAYEALLTERYEEYGLRESEKGTMITNCRQKLDGLLAELANQREYIPLGSLGDIQRALLLQRSLVVDIDQLTSGRTLNCFERYWPIVMSPKPYFRKNERNIVRLAVGSYTIPPAITAQIVVNGDTLNLEPDGTVKYELPTDKRGSHTISTEALVTNPLTGTVRSDPGSYTYEVW